MTIRQVSKFEVVDLGIDYPDCFQGFGLAFTEYSDCCTGVSCDALGALEDALEQAADMGVDCQDLAKRIYEDFPDFLDKKKIAKSARAVCAAGTDAYYHIGLRWS